MLTPGHDVAGVAETEVMALRVKESRHVDRGNYFSGYKLPFNKTLFCVRSGQTCFYRTILNYVLTLTYFLHHPKLLVGQR